MNSKRKQIQTLTLAAFFVAIEVLMGFTPIGYIPVGALNITTMHLPVILGGVLMGPGFGAAMGFVFGLTSFMRATFNPGVTSFVFTPFVQIGNMHGNAFSLLICFGPRILLGVLSALIYKAIRNKANTVVSAGISAVINTVIHTALVLGGIYVFFAAPYAEALGTDITGVGAILLGVVATNMILEAILAGVVVPALVKALSPAAERMGVLYGGNKKAN